MSQFPNLPALVKFTEFGVDHLAFPIGSRAPEHHLGEDGEPMLDLVIVKPLVKDACVTCQNSEARHTAPMPPEHKLGVCAKFVAPPPIEGLSNTQPDLLIHVKHSVPHVSHEFSEDQLKTMEKAGITHQVVYPGGAIPGGRWSELQPRDLYAQGADLGVAAAVGGDPAIAVVDAAVDRAQQISGAQPGAAPVVEKPKEPEPPAGGEGSGTVQ